MARIAERTTEETRDRILEAATEAFAQAGFSAVSTRQVAAAAGVNVATLSYHFGNKQGVYDAAVAAMYERIGEAAEALIPNLASGTHREKIAAIVDISRQERSAVRLIIREVLDHGHMTERTAANHFLPNVAGHSAILAGWLGVAPDVARRTLVTAGFLLSRFAIQDDASLQQALGLDSPDDVRDALIDTLLHFTLSVSAS